MSDVHFVCVHVSVVSFVCVCVYMYRVCVFSDDNL